MNYLAGFLLTRLLLPMLEHSAPARVVNVSSAGQMPIDFDDVMLERDYNGVQAYCQSKLAQVMFTFDLAAELWNKGVTVELPASGDVHADQDGAGGGRDAGELAGGGHGGGEAAGGRARAGGCDGPVLQRPAGGAGAPAGLSTPTRAAGCAS